MRVILTFILVIAVTAMAQEGGAPAPSEVKTAIAAPPTIKGINTNCSVDQDCSKTVGLNKGKAEQEGTIPDCVKKGAKCEPIADSSANLDKGAKGKTASGATTGEATTTGTSQQGK